MRKLKRKTRQNVTCCSGRASFSRPTGLASVRAGTTDCCTNSLVPLTIVIKLRICYSSYSQAANYFKMKFSFRVNLLPHAGLCGRWSFNFHLMPCACNGSSVKRWQTHTGHMSLKLCKSREFVSFNELLRSESLGAVAVVTLFISSFKVYASERLRAFRRENFQLKFAGKRLACCAYNRQFPRFYLALDIIVFHN